MSNIVNYPGKNGILWWVFPWGGSDISTQPLVLIRLHRPLITATSQSWLMDRVWCLGEVSISRPDCEGSNFTAKSVKHLPCRSIFPSNPINSSLHGVKSSVEENIVRYFVKHISCSNMASPRPAPTKNSLFNNISANLPYIISKFISNIAPASLVVI